MKMISFCQSVLGHTNSCLVCDIVSDTGTCGRLVLPVSGLLFSSAGSEGGSRLSSRLLILFLSWISSFRRCLTWDDSSGRGCPFTVETQSIISLSGRGANMWSTMQSPDYPVSTICNKAGCVNCFRLHDTPSAVSAQWLLLKPHVWDTHMHVRLRLTSTSLAWEKEKKKIPHTSLHIYPSLLMFSLASLYDPFLAERGRASTKFIGQEITSSGWKKNSSDNGYKVCPQTHTS